MNMDKLKIKISIAGRIYPLSINRDEEEGIRSASVEIEKIVKQFESNYAVKDKQDLLAMCALQLSSKVENIKGENLIDSKAINSVIDSVHSDITNLIERSLK
tara:strand:- start:11205 stop:11510 length:306 start_codon:yes stop_codon:yes gene_type:complete